MRDRVESIQPPEGLHPQDPEKAPVLSAVMTTPSPQVGTLREKPLHASLKRWCFNEGDRFEVPVDGFVIDVVRNDLLIEIQTRGLSSMKRKLATLLTAGHRVRVVHPIAVDKWIVRLDTDGQVLGRRKSPRHGTVVDVFSELVGIPSLLNHPALELQVVLTQEDEYRYHDPTKAWRRKGWVVQERHLLSVEEVIDIRDAADLATLLPNPLPDPFTTADLATAISRPLRTAQQMAYCLRHTGVIVATGKTGNSILYTRAP